MTDPSDYKYGGARALVDLHDHYLREFLTVWREFSASGLPLPESNDPAYTSVPKLLHHVLAAARSYMTWMCEQLGLPDPGIRETPPEEVIEAEADGYLEHLLERWRHPLVNLTEKAADRTVADSRWGVPYCIDAMLEHAVMHPLRHTHQLRRLMAQA